MSVHTFVCPHLHLQQYIKCLYIHNTIPTMCMVIKSTRGSTWSGLSPSPPGCIKFHSPQFHHSGCFFFVLCVFIMSQVTAITTTWSIKVCMLQCSSITITVAMASTTIGLEGSGQHDVVLSLLLILMDTMMGAVSHTIVSQEPHSISDAFSGLCQLCHGFSSAEFSLSKLSLLQISYVGFCCGVHFPLSCSHVAAMFPDGVNYWACTTVTIWSVSLAGICASCCWSLAHTRMHWVAVPFTTWSRNQFHAIHSAVPQPFHQYGRNIALGVWKRVNQSLRLP